MSRPLESIRLDPRTYRRGLSCVHCGLCLPACPTYTENGLEADSPRGRIQLMLGLHEGKIEPTESVRHHLDLCLDCRACESACPSNVVYHELIEETRAKLPPARLSLGDRLVRWNFLHVLTKPRRLKWAMRPVRALQALRLYPLLRRTGIARILPRGLQKMEQMLPDRGVRRGGRPVVNDPQAPKANVVFFPTCVGSVMAADVNRMAVDLLRAAGCRVVELPGDRCCGAIHHHDGLHAPAEALARQTIEAFEAAGQRFARSKANDPEADIPTYLVSTVAGCGAMLREYGTLLRDDATYADRAIALAAAARDVTEVLADVGLPPMPHRVDRSVAYHDACHLAHAQKVVAQPRTLLSAVPGLKLIPLAESDMCCGAAGTYNLTHPEMAEQLGRRKLNHFTRSGAQTLAAGNIGCSLHLGGVARQMKTAVTIAHPVQILHEAVFRAS